MTPTTAATQERTTDARVTLPRGAAKDMATRADEGFFGPGSVAWKVWTFPTPALQGFFRAVTIEHLDPDLVAAVDDSRQVYKRTPPPVTTAPWSTSPRSCSPTRRPSPECPTSS